MRSFWRWRWPLRSSTIPFIGARLGDAALMRVARPTAIGAIPFRRLLLWRLTYAHVISDFSLVNVIENSHTAEAAHL